MTYPVYIGDRAAGTMTVTAAGEDHLFELFCLARIRAMDGGLWAEYRFEDGYPVPPEEN